MPKKRNIYLAEGELTSGSILWLREDADVKAPDTWRRSRLSEWAMYHPVIVVSTLRSDHKYVWVCMLRSTAKVGGWAHMAADDQCFPHQRGLLSFVRRLVVS
jgi:hypothetical protein